MTARKTCIVLFLFILTCTFPVLAEDSQPLDSNANEDICLHDSYVDEDELQETESGSNSMEAPGGTCNQETQQPEGNVQQKTSEETFEGTQSSSMTDELSATSAALEDTQSTTCDTDTNTEWEEVPLGIPGNELMEEESHQTNKEEQEKDIEEDAPCPSGNWDTVGETDIPEEGLPETASMITENIHETGEESFCEPAMTDDQPAETQIQPNEIDEQNEGSGWVPEDSSEETTNERTTEEPDPDGEKGEESKQMTCLLAQLLKSVSMQSDEMQAFPGGWEVKSGSSVLLSFQFEESNEYGFAHGMLEYQLPDCFLPAKNADGQNLGGSAATNAVTFPYSIDDHIKIRIDMKDCQEEITRISFSVHGVWSAMDSRTVDFGNGIQKKISLLSDREAYTQVEVAEPSSADSVDEHIDEETGLSSKQKADTSPNISIESQQREPELNETEDHTEMILRDETHHENVSSDFEQAGAEKKPESSQSVEPERQNDAMEDILCINTLLYGKGEADKMSEFPEQSSEFEASTIAPDLQGEDPSWIQSNGCDEVQEGETDCNLCEEEYQVLVAILDGNAEDAFIRISGNLPKGATARATPVDMDIPGEDILCAYDVRILDRDGNEYIPSEQSIFISIMMPAIHEAFLHPNREIHLYHVDAADHNKIQRIACQEKDSQQITFEMIHP